MIHWRFARGADIDQFYGERPDITMKAVTICMDEEPVAIIGVAMFERHACAFSDYRPALEPHLRSIPVMRALKAAQRLFAQTRTPLYAQRTTDNELLSRLGFVPEDGEVYRWVAGHN